MKKCEMEMGSEQKRSLHCLANGDIGNVIDKVRNEGEKLGPFI